MERNFGVILVSEIDNPEIVVSVTLDLDCILPCTPNRVPGRVGTYCLNRSIRSFDRKLEAPDPVPVERFDEPKPRVTKAEWRRQVKGRR